MPLRSKLTNDHLGGGAMTVIGLAALISASRYNIGTLAHMGPGFFPAAVGALLAAVGLAIIFAGKAAPEQRTAMALWENAGGRLCILAGLIAFMVVGRYGGLVPATFAVVFISALGDKANGLKQALVLAAAMVVVTEVIFGWLLQINLPAFQWG